MAKTYIDIHAGGIQSQTDQELHNNSRISNMG